MGQAAYDYNTARRRKAPQTQRKTALRVEKGGKRRLSPLQAALRNAMHLVAAALLTGFAISLLMSEAQLVELNDQIQDAKAQLVSAQSQYTYYNSTLNITGILLTMYTKRLLLTQQVERQIEKHYGGKLFSTPITRSVKLSEAPGYGEPIYYYDKSGKGTKEYLSVANELASRI